MYLHRLKFLSSIQLIHVYFCASTMVILFMALEYNLRSCMAMQDFFFYSFQKIHFLKVRISKTSIN